MPPTSDIKGYFDTQTAEVKAELDRLEKKPQPPATLEVLRQCLCGS